MFMQKWKEQNCEETQVKFTWVLWDGTFEKETFSYKEKRKQADQGIDFYFEQYKN